MRRNRLKRIVRAAFRQLDGFVPPGHDLVVICTSGNPTLGSAEVAEEWQSAEKRLKKAMAQLKPRAAVLPAPALPSPVARSPEPALLKRPTDEPA